MKLATDALLGRIRQEDPESWHTVEDLLHYLPQWVHRADAAGDIDPSFWHGRPVEALNRMNMPVAYGGLALTATALRRAVVFEIVGRVCAALPMAMPGPGLAMPPVNALGTEAQRKAFFGRFVGQQRPVWGSFAITEPQGGSDATSMRTVARREGDDYVLSGTKCFITGGRRADVVVVFASIDPSKGRFGIRAFMVERGMPGFSVDRCEDMLGLRASQLAALSFNEVRLPAVAMLGHDGKRGPFIDAFAGAQNAWDYMRPALAAGINGSSRGVIDAAQAALDRGEADLDAAAFEAAQDELEVLRARVHASQLLALRAAWRFDEGQRVSTDASMAKAHASTLAMDVAHRVAQVFPLQATQSGHLFEKFYRDAKGFDILEGTGDMQRLMIARAHAPAMH